MAFDTNRVRRIAAGVAYGDAAGSNGISDVAATGTSIERLAHHEYINFLHATTGSQLLDGYR